MGVMVDRTRRELTEADIQKVGATYHAWRGEKEAGDYTDIPGFCKSAELKEVQGHGYALTPGRYVGSEALGDDDEPFEQKFPRLIAELETQFTESDKLTAQIRHNLKYLGSGK
jgi:type I restriction enzyme M protein